MKIITWNVNGLRSVMQKGGVDFVRQEDPDLLCLQETKCHPDQLDSSLTLAPGWNSFWSAAQRPGYSGTATFSKLEPLEVHHGFGIPKFDTEGRMVVTRFPKFTLFNVYFPNGGARQERHEFKQEFLRRFGQYLLRLARQGEPVIVVGDYNVAYLEHDVYDPQSLAKESGFLPEERAWMTSFLESGFVDAFRYLHPQAENRYTWWAYYENARVGNRGWRIDHICMTRNLQERILSVDILDHVMGSDHCPVRMEIDL